MRKVQATMNCVARWATNSTKNIRTIDLMKRCNWNTVYEIEEIATIMAFWKVLELQTPRQIYEKLTITEDRKVIMKRPRLLICRKNFNYRATKYWNRLPQDLREIKEQHLFKKHLKKYILDRRDLDNTPPTQGTAAHSRQPPGPLRPPGPPITSPPPTPGPTPTPTTVTTVSNNYTPALSPNNTISPKQHLN